MRVNVNCPPDSVVKVFLKPVALLIRWTAAPGSVLPVPSRTTPLRVAVAVCAPAVRPEARIQSAAKIVKRARSKGDFCILCLPCTENEETRHRLGADGGSPEST